MFSLPLDQSVIEALIAISTITVSFIIYTIFSDSKGIKQYFAKKFNNNLQHVLPVLLLRLVGVGVYGIIPILFIIFWFAKNPADYGLSIENSPVTLIGILVALVVFVPINKLTAKSEENIAMYPMMRVRTWSISLLSLSAVSWIVYLFAYEFIYRGFLLFTCANAFGVWPAIIINTSIYSLTHMVKATREGIGAIILGALLSIAVIHIGSFWIAFYVHIVLALSNEWFSLAANPDMKVVFKKKKEL